MISRSIYFNIAFRIVLIVVFSILLGYLFTADNSSRFILMCLGALLFSMGSLIYYLNNTNRNIRFFFDSVRNDDSSLSFPVQGQGNTLKELYSSMNRVNQKIKELKLENRSQEQFFQVLLEQIATGIITYDHNGHVMHANSAAKKLLAVNVLTHIRQIENIDQKLYQTVRKIKPSERRLVPMKTLSGDRQLALKATEFRTGNNSLVLLSIEDIKNELDEKELESWLKLIRVLTHEIMNTITPVTSLSENLLGTYLRDGQPIEPSDISERTISNTIQGLYVIQEQGKGLRSFVESYRKLTRIPEPVRKLFPAEELIDMVRILFASMARGQKAELEVVYRETGLQLFADLNLISQVLINLLKNALEANEKNEHARIVISAGVNADRRTEICVTDNGPGIPEEQLDDIFVPFFTTRENGSGIGLSISRQIMRIHGGNLKVRSVPWKETSFCMTF